MAASLKYGLDYIQRSLASASVNYAGNGEGLVSNYIQPEVRSVLFPTRFHTNLQGIR